jgi:hypothetical protein
MTRPNMNFLKWWLPLLLVIETSCHAPTGRENFDTELEHVLSFLEENGYQNSSNNYLRMILVLTDENCPTCNKSYALFLEKHVADSTIAIVVSASPAAIDISAFNEESATNVVVDHRNQFRNLTALKVSGAILLNGNGIDTIVELSAERLVADFEFIEGHLKRD